MIHCPRCNHQNPEDNRFCGQCGILLKADTAGLARLPAESERRVVTILFADVAGFTAMSDKLDPEAVTAIVNECFTQLSDEIDKYGGIIDKYMGDAIMALFGAPIAHENDPERAIMAALAMQTALKRFSERLERRAGVHFSMRIGINTGPVVAGYVGSHIKSSYTVLGDAVNLASRLQAAAPLGSVLVNEATYRLTQDLFEFNAKEPMAIKGKSEPVQTYEVRAVKTQREGLRGSRGLVSPFVGREKELNALRAAFEKMQTGRLQVVSIIGEAGLGKSRLLYEYERALRQAGYLRVRRSMMGTARLTADAADESRIHYLKGRSIPYGQLNTYWVIAEILRRYLRLDESAAEQIARQRLEAKVPADLVPLIGRFLALQYSDERITRLTAEQLKREMHDALIAILRAESERRPMILIFEDLHWIDASSLDLLHDCIARLTDRPILFIALYRPEFTGLLNFEAEHTVLNLSPLAASENRTLIESILSIAEFPQTIKEQIMLQSGGNPFYVEEIMKSFMDAGLLVQDGSHWKFTREVVAVLLPNTLQGVIMERIDSLEETTKRVLQQSAVIGNIFQEQMLENITDVEQQVDTYLSRLEGQEFVFPHAGSSEPEYIFKHLLSHEVAYNSLLIARRRTFHRRIGHYLEQRYAGRLESHLDVLAHHYYRGGEWLKAIDYAQLAGRHAKALYANQQALQYFSRIIEIAERLESGKSDLLEGERQTVIDPDELRRYRREALTDRGDVRALIGEFETAISDFQNALSLSADARLSAELYWRLGDVYDKRGQFDLALNALQTGLNPLGANAGQVEAAKILATLGWVYLRTGKYDLAERVSKQGLALLNDKDNPIEFALLHKTLGVLDRRRGNFDDAIDHLQLSLGLSQQVGNIRETGRLYNNLAAVYANRGNQAEALKQFLLCLDTMQKIGDASGVANTYNNLGNLYNEMGDPTNALKYHELSLSTRLKIGDAEGVTVSHNNLGMTYLLVNEPTRAIAHLEQGLQIANEIGAKDRLAEIYRQLAQAYLLESNLEKAAEYGGQSLQHAQALGQKLEEAIVTRVLAAIAEQSYRMDEAESNYRQSLDLLGKLGADPELAITHEAYGKFLKMLGRTAEASENLRATLTLYVQLGAKKDEARVQEILDAMRHETGSLRQGE